MLCCYRQRYNTDPQRAIHWCLSSSDYMPDIKYYIQGSLLSIMLRCVLYDHSAWTISIPRCATLRPKVRFRHCAKIHATSYRDQYANFTDEVFNPYVRIRKYSTWTGPNAYSYQHQELSPWLRCSLETFVYVPKPRRQRCDGLVWRTRI